MPQQAQEAQFQQVGSPGDVSQVNPFSQNAFNFFTGGLGQFGAGSAQLARQAAGGFDPLGAQNAFIAGSPGLQNVVLAATSPLMQSQLALGNQLAGTAVQNVASQFGAQGIPISSSAFAQQAARAAGQQQQQALANIFQAQTGLAGQLLGGSQQQLGQAFNLAPQLGLQAAGQLGQLAGLQGQGLQALGRPEFFVPQFVEMEMGGGFADIFGGAMQGAGAGASLGNLLFPGLGGLIGAGLGGLAGGFAGSGF